MSDVPIVGLIARADGVTIVREHDALIATLGGSPPSVTPWPEGSTLAACGAIDGQPWAALALPEAGTAIGRVQADGKLQVHWRIGEPIASLAQRESDGAIFATAPQSGTIFFFTAGQGGARRLATVPRGSGRLGGLAFDDQGGVWAALSDGWSIVRFTMEGQLDRVIGLPVPCPTDLLFTKRDGERQLLVTTQRQSVSLDTLATAPLSGRLLLAAL